MDKGIKNIWLKLISDVILSIWFYGVVFADCHPALSAIIVTVSTVYLTLFTLVNGWGWMFE